MPKHHDRRRGAVQGAKEPRLKWGRQIACFGASGALTGAKAPHLRTLLPKQDIYRSQGAAIYEFMT